MVGVTETKQPQNKTTNRLVDSFRKTRAMRFWVDKVFVYVLFSCAILVLLPLFSFRPADARFFGAEC
jgi:hypothetical protein